MSSPLTTGNERKLARTAAACFQFLCHHKVQHFQDKGVDQKVQLRAAKGFRLLQE